MSKTFSLPDGLLCDLDGVLYRGEQPVPGAAEAIAELRTSGIEIVFATNNATKTVEHYVERLATFGVDAVPDSIVTSAVVTAEEIDRRGWSELSAFVIGGEGIRSALAAIGMEIIEGEAARAAGVVVVSGSPHFTYDHMKTATFAIRNGAHFIATNDDPTFPSSEGLTPGAGAILAGIQTATGATAEVMGKPYRPMMEAAARRFSNGRRIAVVGDQPDTDLAGGRLMGWSTVLVLTGVTGEAALEHLDPPPDLVLATLADLTAFQ